YDGLSETADDYHEAVLREVRENVGRAIAGSAKPLTPWIDRPGRTKSITTFAGSSLGTHTRSNQEWLDLNRTLLDEGVEEIKVWNTISASATEEDYSDQLDTIETLITQLTNEVEDSWDYTDDFDRDDGALGDDWEATG